MKTKIDRHQSNYEVSYLSSNKIRIALNKTDAMEKLKIKEKQLRGLDQLTTYGMKFIRYLNYSNQSTTIYLAEPSVLKLAKRVLSRSVVLDQLLGRY